MNPYARALVLALPLLLALGCSGEKPKKAESNPEKPPAKEISIRAATVEARTVERTAEAVGTLLPWDEVIVNSETSGIVARTVADLGDRVKEGDVLAVLDKKVSRLNLEDARAAHQTNLKALERERAKLKDAETTLKRYDELFKEGMVSASQYDNAKTQSDVTGAQLREAEAKVAQSEARLTLAEKRQADTVIKAPISGEVKERTVSVGQNVNEMTRLFTIVSTGTLKFRGTVPEAMAPRIKNGQQVLINVEAFKDRQFKGTVTRISPSIDPQTRSLEIEATVPNKDALLKPGFFARALIQTSRDANVPFVPESAVYSFVGINKVFTIVDNTARERIVRTGARSGDSIELIDDIKPGEVIAASNLSNLFEGAKVAIIQDKKE